MEKEEFEFQIRPEKGREKEVIEVFPIFPLYYTASIFSGVRICAIN